MQKLALLALALTALATPAVSLTMDVQPDDRERVIHVNLQGDVVEGDNQKFRELITPYLRAGYLLFRVNVFSPGGIVSEAIGIGEQINLLRAQTQAPFRNGSTPEDAVCLRALSTRTSIRSQAVASNSYNGKSWCTCASACSLIWLAGLTRTGNVVGIHRSRITGQTVASMPPEDYRVQYVGTQQQIVTYARKRGLPEPLVERMFATRSVDMHYLEEEDLERLRSDPYLEEVTKARCGGYPPENKANAPAYDVTENTCFRGILKQYMREGVRAYLNGGR